MRLFPQGLTVYLFILVFRASSQAVLVNDDFSDLEARNNAPPNSLLWQYGSYSPVPAYAYSSIAAGGGALVVDHANPVSNNVAFWGHIRAPADPVTVAPGETLSFDFDVRFSGGTFGSGSENFHFSLFNSNASRISPIFAGFSQTSSPYIQSSETFIPWQGYEALLPIMSQGDLFLQKRTGSGMALHDPVLWTEFANSHIQEPAFGADILYHAFLSLTRSADGTTVSLQAGINGVTTPVVQDTNRPFVSFDTVELFAGSEISHDIVVDNVRLVLVPEASTGAFSLLALGLSAARSRLRRG